MCSTVIFGAKSQKYLAENYDFSLDHGLVAVNLRDTVKKTAGNQGRNRFAGVSGMGVFTFNQFSLELPVSGMNEAGLAIALMWHDEGDAGDDEAYIRLSALQWIQYQLDNFRTVAEIVKGLETIRPRQEAIPLHYTVLDANGDTLIVEFIDGEPQLQQNPEYPMLTNSSYQSSLSRAQSPASDQPEPRHSSLARFRGLYRLFLDQRQDDPGPITGFHWLDSVSQTAERDEAFPWDEPEQYNTITAWSIVFSPSESAIYFKTNQNGSVREIRLPAFDFAKEGAYQIMDIHDGMSGSAAGCFRPYAKAYNRAIVQKSGRALQLPEAEQEGLVNLIDVLYQQRQMKLG